MKRLATLLMQGIFILYSHLGHAQSDYPRQVDALLDTIEAHFYDSQIVEKAIPSMREELVSQLSDVKSHNVFAEVVNQALTRLNTSHTYYLTPDDFEYYQLAAIFEERPVIQSLFDGAEITYPSIGILTREIEDEVFIASMLSGGEAERVGLKAGDRLMTLGGTPDFSISHWRKYVGQEVEIAVASTQNETLRFQVTPTPANPRQELLEAQKSSVRLIPFDGKQVGYIHIWSYAGQEYHDALVSAISWGKLKDADALIIDLRYGLGGASPQYLNIFHQEVPELAMLDRSGKKTHFDVQWRKPAAYLVNGFSRSGKEILAYGAKQYGLAYVTGEQTAGAVVAGRLFVMENGDLLYLAVLDALVDGERLEGVGVEPDLEIPMDIRYSQGVDVQIERTVKFLGEKLN